MDLVELAAVYNAEVSKAWNPVKQVRAVRGRRAAQRRMDDLTTVSQRQKMTRISDDAAAGRGPQPPRAPAAAPAAARNPNVTADGYRRMAGGGWQAPPRKYGGPSAGEADLQRRMRAARAGRGRSRYDVTGAVDDL